MDYHFRRKAFIVSVLCISWLMASFGQTEQNEISHSIFIAGPQFTGVIGEDGAVVWDSGRKGARDGYQLENGNFLICWANEVIEYDKNKEIVFSYKKRKSEGKVELGTALRLENGNTMITESSLDMPRILEVDPSGKIVAEVPLKPETENVHMQTRMARKLENGNYLVPHLLAFAVKEYSSSGDVVKTYNTDLPELGGKEAENWPFTAVRLKNGNTLINLTHGNKTVELDKNGKVVWMVSNDDFDDNPFDDACGVQRLSNGNTVIASYHAQEGIKLFEVNRNKKMVWTYSGYRVHHFQILTTNGIPLKGVPMK
ncbi:MAG: hypothetical protein JXQ96_10555 [Cyclobacteriaceae bacterium]